MLGSTDHRARAQEVKLNGVLKSVHRPFITYQPTLSLPTVSRGHSITPFESKWSEGSDVRRPNEPFHCVSLCGQWPARPVVSGSDPTKLLCLTRLYERVLLGSVWPSGWGRTPREAKKSSQQPSHGNKLSSSMSVLRTLELASLQVNGVKLGKSDHLQRARHPVPNAPGDISPDWLFLFLRCLCPSFPLPWNSGDWFITGREKSVPDWSTSFQQVRGREEKKSVLHPPLYGRIPQ